MADGAATQACPAKRVQLAIAYVLLLLSALFSALLTAASVQTGFFASDEDLVQLVGIGASEARRLQYPSIGGHGLYCVVGLAVVFWRWDALAVLGCVLSWRVRVVYQALAAGSGPRKS